MKEIDFNCDVGESYGNFKVGNDEALMPLISSCNIACGFHGGDPLTIEKTVKLALNNNVQIGAHPSYPDLMGFGRRYIQLPIDELQAVVKYQISSLKGITESLGGKLSYVKPHGALYNSIANNEEEAIAVIEAILMLDEDLAIMGLAGSKLENTAQKKNIKFIKEGFADRNYLPNGNLAPRSEEDSVISSVEETVAQILGIVEKGKVKTAEGEIDLYVDSICIHGDNPLAIEILQEVHNLVHQQQLSIKKFTI
ncbi:LamB/YcsF family protein [Marivirga lumbricoides]|uniref:LamB/YcsF family protein n=1 Tax=Marivirga lumbricoides TaxID=1046115 RepID=A0ABQ1MQ83_9BACT|nr:LamB/YcsF family protein [Marivirga lumbricoides]